MTDTNDITYKYSPETLGSLYRAFIRDKADRILLEYSRHTPQWVFEDVAALLHFGDAREEDVSGSQETKSYIYLTDEFKEALKNWKGAK